MPPPVSSLSFQSLKAKPIQGDFPVPGDKSMSHRGLILGALGTKPLHLQNLNPGEDVFCTLRALQALGVSFQILSPTEVLLNPIYPLEKPSSSLDCGNSGTTARLLMGLLCRQPFETRLIGDASLCKRPMKRVLKPLEQLGCVFEEKDHLPLTIYPAGAPQELERSYALEVPSAQVKSAYLLAGLLTPGVTRLYESIPTRPHTEELLTAWGFPFRYLSGQGMEVSTLDSQTLQIPESYTIPGDPSSAAFGIVAALLLPQSQLVIHSLLESPFRLKFLDVLEQMGAQFVKTSQELGLTLQVIASPLKAVEVEASLSPALIDEIPILAVAASFATGVSVFKGLSELRLKESNRLEGTCDLLKAFGKESWVEGDDLFVKGSLSTPPASKPLHINPHNDHRMAMCAAILALLTQGPVEIQNAQTIHTSFPGFEAWIRGQL